MSIRFAVLAAILASTACTSRHLVIPDQAISSGAADFGPATLVVRNFEVKGASIADNPTQTVPDLRASFTEYINAKCRFRDVVFGASAARDPSVAVDVVVDASHTANRTWILDMIGIYPFFPLVPQWGTTRVSVALTASDSGAARWSAGGTAESDYSIIFYSWWRTEPVEVAYREAYREAFHKAADSFCADNRTLRAAVGGPAPQRQAAAPAAAPVAAAASITSGKVAVLDFKNYAKDLQRENVQYFTDLVRGIVLKGAPRFNVITRENLLVLLQASGKDLASCEGECEVDTGRRIGADVIVSGDIQKVGTRYKISLRMHETRDGRLISTAIASGASVDLLDDAATKAADELVAPIR